MDPRARVAGWLFAVVSSLGCVIQTGGEPLPGTPVAGRGGGGGGGPATPPANPIKVDGSWVNATANLAGMDSVCGTLSLMSAPPDRDMLIAGVITRGLFVSRDGATQWTQMGQGPGSEPFTHGPSTILYDPAHPGTFWESGIYGNSFGVYKTTDDGVTFKPLGNFFHNDAVSVDLTDPERKTLLVGTHEQTQKLHLSSDGGVTWRDIGPNVPGDAGFSVQPIVIDASTYLLGTYSGPQAGVYRSTNAGGSWTKVFDVAVRNSPLLARDQSIYWLLENNQGLIRSTDKGASWTRVTGGGIIDASPFFGGGLAELPDGRIAALGRRFVMLSADRGATWRPLSVEIPRESSGFIYSSFRKAFYVYLGACGNNPVKVADDAILRLDFDYQKS